MKKMKQTKHDEIMSKLYIIRKTQELHFRMLQEIINRQKSRNYLWFWTLLLLTVLIFTQ